ncbi:MAG: class I SAM-dependent methyltransferase, partial [Bacilli bacterium]|nr:class I SAM-dependent methyltransferase [Bacilli bacterium]
MNKAGLLKQLTLRGISCSDQQLDRLMHFMKTVIFTNDSFNLTAITNESEFLDKMVLDSALALVGNDFSGKKVIDVGTGAG